MARKLFDARPESPISPVIDIVMNGMAAMFILLMIYTAFVRRSDPPRFLAGVEPPPAMRGQSYVFTFPVTGGSGKRVFSLRSGPLPPGLRFDPETGTIYGVPEQAGDRSSAPLAVPLQVDVQDGARESATRSATLRLYLGARPYSIPLHISRQTTELPPGRVGVPYEAVLGSSGGVEPYTWNVGSDRLPRGLRLEHGRLVGTPQLAGVFQFTAHVSHNQGEYTYQGTTQRWAAERAQRPYHVEILAPLQQALHTPVGRVGEPYLGLVLTNGSVPGERVQWTATVPGLQPSGPERALRGTPSTPGVFPVSYQISSEATPVTAGTGEVRILPRRPAPSVPPVVFHARVGETVRFALPYRGLDEPVSSMPLTPLPPGLRLVDDGSIVGTPEQTGLVTTRVQVTGARGDTATGDVTLWVGSRRVPLALEAPAVIDVVVGRAVYVSPTATGGTGDYAWDLQGQLPPTVGFAPTGVLTGTLSALGMWPLDVTVRDRLTGETASRSLTLRGVYADDTQPRVVTTSLPTAIVGTPFVFAFAVAGGVGVPHFRFQGPLPEGLVFTEAGIAGTPTRSGGVEFEVTVTDAVAQQDGPKRFTLQVEEVDRTRPAIVTNALPPAVPGLPYTQALAAEGGFGAYTWALSGQLPPQLAFTPNGIIQGSIDPLAQGTWPLQVVVQDAKGQSAPPKDLALRIDAGWPALTLEKTPPPSAVKDAPYHTRLVAHSCWGACTWSITGLPEGLELTQGAIVGTPRRTDTYVLAVTASDARGRQASATYTLQVLEPPPSLKEP